MLKIKVILLSIVLTASCLKAHALNCQALFSPPVRKLNVPDLSRIFAILHEDPIWANEVKSRFKSTNKEELQYWAKSEWERMEREIHFLENHFQGSSSEKLMTWFRVYGVGLRIFGIERNSSPRSRAIDHEKYNKLAEFIRDTLPQFRFSAKEVQSFFKLTQNTVLLTDFIYHEINDVQAARLYQNLAIEIGLSTREIHEILKMNWRIFNFNAIKDHSIAPADSKLSLSTKRMVKLESMLDKPLPNRPLTRRSPLETGKELVNRQQEIFRRLLKASGFSTISELRLAIESEVDRNSSPRVKAIYNLIRSGQFEIRIHVKKENLPNILAFGFKNIFSGGSNSVSSLTGGRNIFEANMLNLPVDRVMELHPDARGIYGLIAPSAEYVRSLSVEEAALLPLPPGYRDRYNEIQEAYGEVVLIFRPADLLGQVTWTPGDSGNLNQSYSGAYNVSEIRQKAPVSFDQVYIPWEARDLMLLYLLNSRNETFSPANKSESESDSHFMDHLKVRTDVGNTGPGNSHSSNYFEAQIFGNDLMPRLRAVESSEQLPPEILLTLKDRGVRTRMTDWQTWPPREF